jgi:hypothetical protein
MIQENEIIKYYITNVSIYYYLNGTKNNWVV